MCKCAAAFCTTAAHLVSRFSRFRSTLSFPNSLLLFLSFSAFCHPKWNGEGWALQESNTYFIPGYLLGTDAALFPALRGRKWLKNQRFIFTLGKDRITALHLLGPKHIRINADIPPHGKVVNTMCLDVRGGCVTEHIGHLKYITVLHHCANCLRNRFSRVDCLCVTE